jgi:hypothetical protein
MKGCDALSGFPESEAGSILANEPEALQEGFGCREARRRSARQIASQASGVFTTNPRLSVSKMRPIFAWLTDCLSTSRSRRFFRLKHAFYGSNPCRAENENSNLRWLFAR